MIAVLTAVVRECAAIALGFVLVAFLALVLLMAFQRAAEPAPMPPGIHLSAHFTPRAEQPDLAPILTGDIATPGLYAANHTNTP